VLVDIRSSMEFLFVGHPSGAVHIAWIDEPDWTVNPHFVTDIRKLLLGGVSCDEGKGCAPVILICRSGKRSLEAGRVLLANGLPRVYHVDEGFEGELDEHRARVVVEHLVGLLRAERDRLLGVGHRWAPSAGGFGRVIDRARL
jgi:rhodanese-related sulfurtransferase